MDKSYVQELASAVSFPSLTFTCSFMGTKHIVHDARASSRIISCNYSIFFRNYTMSLQRREIAERFFTLFTVKNQTALAEYLEVTPSVVTEWKKGRSAVPWEKLTQAVEKYGITWDWLLLGRGEKYAVNLNQKPAQEPFDKEGTNDVAYDKKRDMKDSIEVELLKDHLATLKQDKADLQARTALLEKEVSDLREENKRLLTLSSAKATTQAGSA